MSEITALNLTETNLHQTEITIFNTLVLDVDWTDTECMDRYDMIINSDLI